MKGLKAMLAISTFSVLSLASPSMAQDTGTEGGADPAPADQTDTATGDGAEDQRDDPFSLEGIVEPPSEAKDRGPDFKPSEQRPARLPELNLRGIGRMSGDVEPTVLLEVGGLGLFIVREGDTISLQNLPGDNVLRILEINDISVTVEAGSFGELIVVR